MRKRDVNARLRSKFFLIRYRFPDGAVRHIDEGEDEVVDGAKK